MSTIVNPTSPFSSMENDGGGLDIKGFLNQENYLNGSNGNDVIIGGDVNDTLFGFSGNDFIDGRGGNDIIAGGSGNDTLIGGLGNDIFVFDRNNALTSGEIDIIEDFVPGEDSLGIQGLTSGDNVDYNTDTGVLSINGQAFAQLDTNLNIQDSDLDFNDLIFGGSHPTTEDSELPNEDSKLPIEDSDFDLL